MESNKSGLSGTDCPDKAMELMKIEKYVLNQNTVRILKTLF